MALDTVNKRRSVHGYTGDLVLPIPDGSVDAVDRAQVAGLYTEAAHWMDIRDGDQLVIGTKSYPVRAVESRSGAGLSRASFAALATATASTRRAPAITGGLRGDPATNIVSLKCMPPFPLSAETRKRMVIETPYQALETIVFGDPFLVLVLEDLKI
jgi:hypothetical protein